MIFDTIPEYIKKGLHVHILILCKVESRFYHQLKQHPNLRIIAPKTSKSPYAFSHIFWLRTHIKQYSLIHVHLFPSLYWVALAKMLISKKIKLVYTEHSTSNKRRNSLLFKFTDKFIYKKYQKIIAISNGVEQQLKQHIGQSNTNITTINNGVNISNFINAQPYSFSDLKIPEQSQLIIQVSSFYPPKDQATLISAIAVLPDNVHLLLVGDGPLINERKVQAESLQVSNRVHFLGRRTDVNRLVKTANICVQSSHYEGFGLSIVEGMAAKKPCIGSNVEGLSEVLENAGLLFEKGNYKMLASQLQSLLNNNSYYEQIAERCFEKAKSYDLNLMVEKHINLYNNVMLESFKGD